MWTFLHAGTIKSGKNEILSVNEYSFFLLRIMKLVKVILWKNEKLEQNLNFLQLKHHMEVEVLLTDCYRQINKWLREKHPEITQHYERINPF